MGQRTVRSYATRHEAAGLLAAHVGEPFYSVLAARLDQNELSGRKRESLDRYRDEKSLLQHNLRTELAYILAQDPAIRGGLLTALAQKQEAQILALENRAEAMRSALFRRDYAWDAAHKPRLTDTEPGAYGPEDVAHVMLGAAFFQSGRSPAQRTVLREIAIEVRSSADSVATAVAAQPYVFFSPGPSRLRLPADLPADVGAKLAAYQTKKSALRKELYDAVYREDATWLGVVRTLRFSSLAEKQAPEFAALEALAEEIRRGLPPLPAPRPTRPAVPLSPALVERIDALRQRQFTEEQAINVQFDRSRAGDSALQLSTVFIPEIRRYELRSGSRFRSGNPKASERVRVRFDELTAAYDRLDAALTDERNAIRREIAESLHTADPARINLALAGGVRLALEQKSAEALRDYQVAILTPGLSPAQRRLLFAGAIENLALPLPVGVMQPLPRLQQQIGRVAR
ncbi:MAG: hypothetical protein EXS32_08680 [Opitutus sp.]|nr:hypothetical protein [Opitutus sp.]